MSSASSLRLRFRFLFAREGLEKEEVKIPLLAADLEVERGRAMVVGGRSRLRGVSCERLRVRESIEDGVKGLIVMITVMI